MKLTSSLAFASQRLKSGFSHHRVSKNLSQLTFSDGIDQIDNIHIEVVVVVRKEFKQESYSAPGLIIAQRKKEK